MPTPKSKTSSGASAVISPSANNGSNPERESVFNAFRQWGYLEGDLDPLGFLRPRPTPELQIEGEYAREARSIYSSTIGVEINHIYAPERDNFPNPTATKSNPYVPTNSPALDDLFDAFNFKFGVSVFLI